MTPDHSGKPTAEPAQISRYEISAAMNAVVRTCADIVRAHSHRGFWTHQATPTATHRPHPSSTRPGKTSSANSLS